jgi:SAM-dependent methyltransferase
MSETTPTAGAVRNFWQERALDPALAGDRVTHPDRCQRLLENQVLLAALPASARVLDVGCGNGFSTARLAERAGEVVGIDYSPAMIERARREHGHLRNVTFAVQDVLALDLPPASFDGVVSQRCLINLTSWEDQQQAIRSLAGVLKPGGSFIMQEGTRQGREALNRARERLGLPRMPPVAYNLDFDEERLWPFLETCFAVVEVRRFGLYDLISRIVHPLLVRPEEPRYEARINEVAGEVAAALPGMDELSREFSAHLRRREAGA